MSVPIAVKFYKDDGKLDHPERFMTLSYGRGFDYDKPIFYPNQVVNDIIDRVKEYEPELDYDTIEIHYFGIKIIKDMTSSLVKVEGNLPNNYILDLNDSD